MCGICGNIQLDGGTGDLSAVQRMAQSMLPRGPDGGGLVQAGRVTFAHRRLKIIDLSDASHQPMVDSELGLTGVFNGAIYNFPELRGELERMGYRFFSSGDTEVILKAYHAWGVGAFAKMNGMFAIALCERDSGKVVLARDRLGIKPLYYAPDPAHFRFASTLNALLAGGGVDTSIDPVALNYYMTFHAVVPPPHTIIRGVRKLPPASYAILQSDGSLDIGSYWSVVFGTPSERTGWSEEDWIEATLDVLRRSVRRRMIADVPVGVLLSGGLDSSLIVGLLCEQGVGSLETFSIGFESVGDEKGDEFQYSDLIADRFGTSHHRLPVDSARALPAVHDCIANMSEPMVSHDNVGFYLLSREVANFVKVVQSGQGADEIFGGYHWYPPMMNAKDALTTYAENFFDRDFREYAEAVSPRLVKADYASEFVARRFAEPGAQSPIDKALRIDALVMLVDDPVKRVDNNTMAASLEARVPFLDHEVVEFAATVPPELKIRDGGKYILKEAARRIIPAEVIDRTKGYFPVPALKYLRGDFLEMTREAVTGTGARQRGIFCPAYIDKLLAAPEDHLTPLRGSKLWQIALLELWLDAHINP